ncbi:hypothetical protein FQN60_006756, partial [Etheostoma spectabile]
MINLAAAAILRRTRASMGVHCWTDVDLWSFQTSSWRTAATPMPVRFLLVAAPRHHWLVSGQLETCLCFLTPQLSTLSIILLDFLDQFLDDCFLPDT